jgi:nicotinate phosphoribosyltransferase
LASDVVSLANDGQEGETLLRPVMRGGHRLRSLPDIAAARDHAKDQLARLPQPLTCLKPYNYPVEIGTPLRELAAELDRGSDSDGTT